MTAARVTAARESHAPTDSALVVRISSDVSPGNTDAKQRIKRPSSSDIDGSLDLMKQRRSLHGKQVPRKTRSGCGWSSKQFREEIPKWTIPGSSFVLEDNFVRAKRFEQLL